MTGNGFIEDDVTREVIFAGQVADTPANSVVFIAYKDGFIATRTTFCSEFRRDRGEALAPPYVKMREIWFSTMHDLIRGGICWERRCREAVTKVLCSESCITPKGER